MQSAAQRDHIVRVGSWLILAFVLLPNISYMGHWPEMAGTADDHHDAAAPVVPSALDAATEEHADHCHVGPAHCGGGESMIGTPFVGESTEGLALPGHEIQIDAEFMLAALSGHATPILQPPRSV
jgi:hypothetical protein